MCYLSITERQNLRHVRTMSHCSHQGIETDAYGLTHTPLLFLPSFTSGYMSGYAGMDVDDDNGPMEIAPGTHRMDAQQAQAAIRSGARTLRRVLLRSGDVVVRDPRSWVSAAPVRPWPTAV